MSTVEEAIAAQIQDIETTYGRSIAHWAEIVCASGLRTYNDVAAMLRTDYGMAQGAAHRVSLTARRIISQGQIVWQDDPMDQACTAPGQPNDQDSFDVAPDNTNPATPETG